MKHLSAATGTGLVTAVIIHLFRLGSLCSKKSKAASIKMTLAAVVLDAENYSRSCASVLLHDGEKRDVSRLEASAPRAGCARDDINRYSVVQILHKFSFRHCRRRMPRLQRMSEDKRSRFLCQSKSPARRVAHDVLRAT